MTINATWNQALDLYWTARRRDLSPHTALDYSNTFARFSEHVGDKSLKEIVSRDIHEFLNDVQDRYALSRKTLSNYWIALSSFWTWAEVELEVPHIIRGRVPRPRFRRKSIAPYTVEEVRLLLEACDKMRPWRAPSGDMVYQRRPTATRDRAIIVTLIDTGVRCGELCDLQIRDFDRHRRQLLIRHGKGDKERMVYLGESAMSGICAYLDTRPKAKTSEPLFTTIAGESIDRHSVRKLITRLAEKAQVRRANVHRFRHTFAINFLRNGGNMIALQDLLGHETLETIRLYVRLAQTDLQQMHQAASPVDNWNLSPVGSHP